APTQPRSETSTFTHAASDVVELRGEITVRHGPARDVQRVDEGYAAAQQRRERSSELRGAELANRLPRPRQLQQHPIDARPLPGPLPPARERHRRYDHPDDDQ